MNTHNHPVRDSGEQRSSYWRSPAGMTLAVFLAVAGLLLVFEHRVHLAGAWPLLFLILCGGMHFFMHRGHGGHGGRGERGGNDHAR